MDPQYANRIFKIFQRLHTREEYHGTGVGLAVVKKLLNVMADEFGLNQNMELDLHFALQYRLKLKIAFKITLVN